MIRIKSYYTYWKHRVDAHGIHSPFVFDFYNTVLAEADKIYDTPIRRVYHQLRRDHRKIQVTDFGAGTKHTHSNLRKISSIAHNASVSRRYGKLMTRLAERYNLNYAVELGTSLGLGSMYIAQASCMKKLITIEGDPALHAIASENFKMLNLQKIDQRCGRFEDHLYDVVKQMPQIDLVYIDGNHTYEATMNYFNFFLNHVHDSSFMIFDDIRWSDEMEKAWNEISASTKINVSMDLLRMGVVCKRPGQAKQHFILKY
ncbi:MAG: class I SAM-dependent methyltransferase [Crocinitomicaceae bacterium]|nr:class I SAM-dependent methyltransferase [Crocinitomicaceae bacterium]MBK8926001.1 class I SAM-dependent methyltransferase [Crocinitomicaceae bacterium]